MGTGRCQIAGAPVTSGAGAGVQRCRSFVAHAQGPVQPADIVLVEEVQPGVGFAQADTAITATIGRRRTPLSGEQCRAL